MNSKFKKVLDFKGYGNPKNSTWFIGIEEALEYDENSIKQTYHKEVIASSKGDYYKEKEKFQKENPNRRYTSVYEILGKIMSEVLRIDYSEYMNDYIFTEKGDCFLTNFYPLGKRSTKTALPEKYKEWFDIHSEPEYQYLVKANRGKELYEFWVDNKPRITVAFGVQNWGNIKTAFKLQNSHFESFDDKMEYCSEHNFYLCPFFVNHQMSGDRIKKLVDKIKSEPL